MILDNNGRMVEMNSATCEVFGYLNKELKQIKIQNLAIDDTFRKLLIKITQTSEQKKLRGECTILKKDQTLKEIEYSAVSNITHGYHLVIIRDITERKEEEQRRNHFLGIASHELKNALAGVKSFTQLLERRLDHDTRNQEYVRRIDTSVDRLKRLIDDLMDLTKIRAGKLELMREITDIKPVAIDILEEFKSSYKTHTITYKVLKSGLVCVDKIRIEQVLLNLLRNAVKYSEPGTPITVSMVKNPRDIIIEIQDKGMGISKKDQKRIFELFFQAEKPAYTTTGMGIGLYISSEIIKMHGGTISVQSKKGEGSTFSISLPLHI
jgi:PAS domain S-box-containing protein